MSPLADPRPGDMLPVISVRRGRRKVPYAGPDWTDRKTGARYQCCELTSESWFVRGSYQWMYVRVGDRALFKSIFALAQIQWQRELARVIQEVLISGTPPALASPELGAAKQVDAEVERRVRAVMDETVKRMSAPRRRLARGAGRV